MEEGILIQIVDERAARVEDRGHPQVAEGLYPPGVLVELGELGTIHVFAFSQGAAGTVFIASCDDIEPTAVIRPPRTARSRDRVRRGARRGRYRTRPSPPHRVDGEPRR